MALFHTDEMISEIQKKLQIINVKNYEPEVLEMFTKDF